jgi:hypothetical protein
MALHVHHCVEFVPKRGSPNGKDNLRYRLFLPISTTNELRMYLAMLETGAVIMMKGHKEWVAQLPALTQPAGEGRAFAGQSRQGQHKKGSTRRTMQERQCTAANS